jgi:uncharacterized membrane protein YeiH
MFEAFTDFLDWFGLCVFALSGALVASRKQMDITGFALLGCVTGVGGGTLRDVMLGRLPVFWVQKPYYLLACVAVSCFAFFVVHHIQTRPKYLIWSDAIGLSLFSVTGAELTLRQTDSSIVAIAMGVATATLGGVVRDIIGGDIPVILRREIYVTASCLGAAVFVLGHQLGIKLDVALVAGFCAAFGLRAAAIRLDLSLPVFKQVE